MRDFQPHFGGVGDVFAIIALALAGTIIGLAAAAFISYQYIRDDTGLRADAPVSVTAL